MEEVEEEKEVLKCILVCKKKLEDCQCSALEERSKKVEIRCVELELELQKIKSENNALEAKFKAFEVEKLAIEDELMVLKGRNEELKEKDKSTCEKGKDMERVIDLTVDNEEEDEVFQLKVENKVLECEKKKAGNEIKVWKDKFEKLKSQILHLNGTSNLKIECLLGKDVNLESESLNLHSHEENGRNKASEWIKSEDYSHVVTDLNSLQNQKKVGNLVNNSSSCVSPGTPSSDMLYKKTPCLDSEVKPGRQVRKQLTFKEAKSSCKMVAPSTPSGAKPASPGLIDIIDSDDESNITRVRLPIPDNQGNGRACVSTYCETQKSGGIEEKLMSEQSLQGSHNDCNDEEEMEFNRWNNPSIATPKRKRTSNVIRSDSESDDDNVPISKLMRMRMQELKPDQVSSDLNSCSVAAISSDVGNVTGVTPARRRLRKCQGKGELDKKGLTLPSKSKYDQGIPTNVDVSDNELEEEASESEGESLGGFIVNSSEASDSEKVSSNSQDVSHGNMELGEVLSKFKRKRDSKKWEFEGDMLAAFGKDPELCMKAVCALYRQQTSDEQISKGTLVYNHRGFNKFDAFRGSDLAEFLTDGDPHGDLKKSVNELHKFDPRGVELCNTLAARYSKQLFEIYKKKEDPHFHP
ncbi:Homeobox-leucine zipper HOX24 [Quillaja saponaria]|uniref:Homeobox-leucine zipper HOX24 n=1 Tax=Quillaja saponaria TaxID=32244 RepID=A0AAD7LJF6_QUISA|nr:Homeobox-leucine zipper HOX24 [Quillaja saponaria]